MSAQRIQAWRELPPDVRAEVERLTRAGDVGDTERWHRAADVLQAMGERVSVVEPRDYLVKSGPNYLVWVERDAAPPPWAVGVAPAAWMRADDGARYMLVPEQWKATRCTYREALNRRIEVRRNFDAKLVRLRHAAVILSADQEELEDWRTRLGNVDHELPFGSGPAEVQGYIAQLEAIVAKALDVPAHGLAPAKRTALAAELQRAGFWRRSTSGLTDKGRALVARAKAHA
jgi:hypothetical protein